MSARGSVLCRLCPRSCLVAPGQRGDCLSRVNLDGRLISLVYGRPAAVHVDPIEKKPMNHFLPGSRIFSLATAGCNLHCRFCQNWQLSQRAPEEMDSRPLPPGELPALVRRTGCRSVAFTYSEPVVFIEYALDSARACQSEGIPIVLVTAAWANPAPWAELCAASDGANIDLKGFSERFYQRHCGGSLRPVLDNIVAARQAGLVVELTNLLIPTLNDQPKMIREMARWIVRHVGRDTPLHLSRFHPMYRVQDLPPTPASTLVMAWEIARDEGLDYVYVGNLAGNRRESTHCPRCGLRLIHRSGYHLHDNRIRGGECPQCGASIYGRWD